MAKLVIMPKLGMYEADVQLVSWYKQEGDTVAIGDKVASIEGDKITNDIEATISGVLLKKLAIEGEKYPIGTTLGIIGEVGEDISALLNAQDNNKPLEQIHEQSSEPMKPIDVCDEDTECDSEDIKASPVARKLAKEKGVCLCEVAKTLNSKRRIKGDDVLAYIESHGSQKNGQIEASDNPYTETKLIGLRKTIAERMSKSSHETAPVVLMRSVDITELKEMRDRKKKEAAKQGLKVPSFNDLVMKATALALQDHPRLNATFDNGVVRTYNNINLNIAIATDTGLITPVIPDTNKISVWEISEKSIELAGKAKNGTLESKDMMGGTFTVTNLGMLDIEVSTPILNPPQVAILAVGTIQPYLVIENGQVRQRYKTFLSLTLDHRVVDGYPGAQYLYTLANILQSPELLWK